MHQPRWRRHVPTTDNDAVATTPSTGGRAGRRLRVGLKAGPGTAARLEAGNCGEGFVSLFRVCVVLPHQACAGGSVFFCRRLSKAGLSESTHHIRLILDPSSRSDLHCSTCGSFSSTCTNVRGLHLAQVLAPLLLGAVTTVCICYPSRQAATLAQARMSRMAASSVSARMSNMKRIPAHRVCLQARERSVPCADTR